MIFVLSVVLAGFCQHRHCCMTLTMASLSIPSADNVDNDRQCRIFLCSLSYGCILLCWPALLCCVHCFSGHLLMTGNAMMNSFNGFLMLVLCSNMVTMTGNAVSISHLCIPDGNAVPILCFLVVLFCTSFWMTGLPCVMLNVPGVLSTYALFAHHSERLKWVETKVEWKPCWCEGRTTRGMRTQGIIQECWTIPTMMSAWI